MYYGWMDGWMGTWFNTIATALNAVGFGYGEDAYGLSLIPSGVFEGYFYNINSECSLIGRGAILTTLSDNEEAWLNEGDFTYTMGHSIRCLKGYVCPPVIQDTVDTTYINQFITPNGDTISEDGQYLDTIHGVHCDSIIQTINFDIKIVKDTNLYFEVPDTIFEQYLVDIGKDDVIDGYILKDSAITIDTVNLIGDGSSSEEIYRYVGISDFKPIDKLTNLTYLTINLPGIDFIDLSHNKKLNFTSIYHQYNYDTLYVKMDEMNGFISLYSNFLMELTYNSIGVIERFYTANVNFVNTPIFNYDHFSNQYESLRFDFINTNLFEINIKGESGESIESLELAISDNDLLRTIDLRDMGVLNAVIKNNQVFESLRIKNKNDIQDNDDLHIENNSLLKILNLSNIKNVDIYSNDELEIISGNNIPQMQIINNSKLDTVILKNSELLSINNNDNLNGIYIDSISSASFNLSGNTKITTAVISNAQEITSLNLSNSEFLTCLNLEGCTDMTDINLNNCYSLSCVQVESNYIPIFPNKISSQESVGSYEVTDICSECDFSIPEYIDDVIDEDSTIVGRLEYKKELFIYPNPADDLIILQMKSNDYSSLVVRNITGQIVMQEQINNPQMQLDGSDLESGIYFIQLQGTESSATQKIVIN